ncbi:hypothetical protein A3F32_01995 [Candidatus Roizmanbacteria bacterium RIFCSPHIGHO2_12_FULL_42_10]|uniref:DUF11 domain-containing protein n=1 Tax=Candidatus Roizmanbacteria bacterium RIFCSPHIGHO2_12_FULL_42_10 TaxID=1802053 RepID=A0A1F7I2P4_9BACT|nr:MAG: hypothetical protein A3F32_01995 [Candidatus Roizmanbacteria bacterium RIFCSPHIGHO2_12_FULL_42_10]
MRLRTIVTIAATGVLLANQLLLPATVLAQEASSSAEEPIISPIPESPTPTPTPVEDTSSLTETGDAQSSATADISTNQNYVGADGNIQATDCALTGEVCPISIDNSSDTDVESTSSATTGGNGAEGFQDSTIETGDATSFNGESSLINGNVVTAEDSQTPADDSEQDSTVALQNEATHSATTTSEAESGLNTIDAEESGTIETGDSVAATDQVNIINTNIIGSSVDYFSYNVFDDSASIDINALWKALSEQALLQGSTLDPADPIYILIANNANVSLNASSQADSGDNTINADSAVIHTGDAYASTSVFNLINLNILGSTIMFGVINIFGNLTGDIILPNMDRFFEQNILQNEAAELANQYALTYNNTAVLSSNISAQADSGSNTQIGTDVSLQSGNAFAYAVQRSFLNMNFSFNDIFLLFLNNFGYWEGGIKGWSAPDGNDTQSEATGEYSNAVVPEALMASTAQDPATGLLANNVYINANLSAQALSGRNATQGTRSFMTTGTAIAAAHLINILNTNLLGNKLLIPIINIFGSWKGNLIFAYPDLAVTISADREEVTVGDAISYTVYYINNGYEDARHPSISISLPSGEVLTGSSIAQSSSGPQVSFQLGTVAPHQSGNFTFTTTLASPPQDSQASSNSLIEQIKETLFKPALADSGDLQAMTTTANIVSEDNDSNTKDNSAVYIKYYNPNKNDFDPTIIDQTEPQGSAITNGLAQLSVNSQNNINDYIYAGDTILYTVSVFNSGTATARDVLLRQTILDGQGLVAVQNLFSLGSVNPNETRKIVFQLRIPPTAHAGTYTSMIAAKGLQPQGGEVFSNESLTTINIKSRALALAKPVQAADLPRPGQIKGASVRRIPTEKVYWPFVVALFLSSLWAAEVYRRQRILDQTV